MNGPADVAATFCATLVEEWQRAGVTDVVLSPGSRSTPLALAVAGAPGVRVHVHHDERSAGFLALGLGLATGRPAVVLTTSGTAAVELHPAVVEAHHARVPLLAVTADRPPELLDVGAPQTIDQSHLFGDAVRWHASPGVPDAVTRHTWAHLAARAVTAALAPVPGPVHLNLAFREPLVGDAEATATTSTSTPAGGRPRPTAGVAWPAGAFPADADTMAELAALAGTERGVIVAGAGSGDPDALHGLAETLGWPLLADPRSGARRPGPATVAAADAILRHAGSARRLRPDVVLRLGDPPASKVLAGWLAGSDATSVLVHRFGAWIDPDHTLARIVAADPAACCAALAESAGRRPGEDRAWLGAWTRRESAAQGAIEAVLAGHPEPTEPGVARSVVAASPPGSTLVVSSSMPVRDVEWFGSPREGLRVLSNRGANGIDGVTSTAVGVALGSDAPTAALIGDVAFLHDTNGMLGLARRGADLTLVVIDNDGGGIFSFLAQRAQLGEERFEQLFATPHGVDLAALASVHGVAVDEPATSAEVGPAVAAAMAAGGARVVLVRTDRDANVAVHAEITTAVGAALEGLDEAAPDLQSGAGAEDSRSRRL